MARFDAQAKLARNQSTIDSRGGTPRSPDATNLRAHAGVGVCFMSGGLIANVVKRLGARCGAGRPDFPKLKEGSRTQMTDPGESVKRPARPSELRSLAVKSPLVVMRASASAARSTGSDRYRTERPQGHADLSSQCVPRPGARLRENSGTRWRSAEQQMS
jgi:hypothetical protein